MTGKQSDRRPRVSLESDALRTFLYRPNRVPALEVVLSERVNSVGVRGGAVEILAFARDVLDAERKAFDGDPPETGRQILPGSILVA
jgi:hypothetical protein